MSKIVWALCLGWSVVALSKAPNVFGELPTMLGGPAPSAPLGVWPAVLAPAEQASFLAWLAPSESLTGLVMLGAKRWGDEGMYVGAACFAPDEQSALQAQRHGEQICGVSYVAGTLRANRLYLGVFSLDGSTVQGWRPVARLDRALSAPAVGDEPALGLPEAYVRLDLAPYRINDQEMAIGVRKGAIMGVGMAYEANLLLYRWQGTRLVKIFEGLVYELGEALPGAPETDHRVRRWQVVMLPTQTHGFYDLQRRQGTQKITYRWSQTQGRYQRQ